MRVRDLGTLTVASRDGEYPLRGRRAAAMLALLAVNANSRVSVDALMDAAWGNDVTVGTMSTLESHIWRLRQLLEPDRAPREASTVLINDTGGFRLVAGPSSLDSLFFQEEAAETSDLLAAGDASSALTQIDRALRLWRGSPFSPFADEEWAVPVVARLQELRAQLEERRIEALVELGEIDHALADVSELTKLRPLQESLLRLHMLALYRSGRSEDALQAYQRGRRVLLEALGTEPSPLLSDLQRQILDHDPALAPRPTTTAPLVTGPVSVPSTLSRLIGRDAELGELLDLLRRRLLVTVVGPAGSGKTRLAIEVGRRASPMFPDGVWFIDLAMVTDPGLVADVVASAVGFVAASGPALTNELSFYLRSRRTLIILDNCEHVLVAAAALAGRTLGSSDEAMCTVLATSREPLDIDGETTWTLEALALPGPATARDNVAPALELFLERFEQAAPRARLDDFVVQRGAIICRAVDGLPLPIELAAARAQAYTLDDIARQVTDDPTTLRRPGRAHSARRSSVWDAIEWSHQLLTPLEQCAHRRLSALAGRFTEQAAAAVIGSDLQVTRDALAQLVHRSMLTRSGSDGAVGLTTFRQLATIRAHAVHALADAGETPEVSGLRDTWVASLIARRPRLGSTSEPEWYAAVDDDYSTVRVALVATLTLHPAAVGIRIARALPYYWYYRSKLVEGSRWMQLAHELARGGDATDTVLTALPLSAMLTTTGRVHLATAHIEHALGQLDTVTDDRLVDVGEALVGLATAAWAAEQLPVVVAAHGHLAQIANRVGDDHLTVLADAVGCTAAFAAGDASAAAAKAEEVYERAGQLHNLMAQWIAAGSPAIAALLAGRPDTGMLWVRRLIGAHLPLGSGAGGSFTEAMAGFAFQSHELEKAAMLYAAARRQTRQAGMVWPRRARTRELIYRTREALDQGTFQRAWRAGEAMSLTDVAQIEF